MITAATLDVTKIEPKLKHPTIFRHFDDLDAGEAFMIFNDHDPKPLYYQLLGERGNIFTWEYQEEGPEWWKVKIAKRGEKEAKESIGEMAAKDIRKAAVFQKMGIDFCCGGKKTVKEACEEAGITEQQLDAALKDAEQAGDPGSAPVKGLDFNSWDLDFLADYIQQVHHRYIRDNAGLIEGLAVKVAGHHGINHPELRPLASNLRSFLHEMLLHLEKEERLLFPYIKQIAAGKRTGKKIEAFSIASPIHVMEMEHAIAGDEIKHFRQLTRDYTLPGDACNSYTYLFEKLKEFENDLFRHVHLENNILFPRALQLEKEV